MRPMLSGVNCMTCWLYRLLQVSSRSFIGYKCFQFSSIDTCLKAITLNMMTFLNSKVSLFIF